ncbi:hypothetical protein GCM10022207_76850 [Streptomyces lannensis]|uniref:Uncharacterized protein n=1 Tax=Streptomyces lannensis TaxID=766498 RepID=A0ABP7LDZ5_9ACTN
MAPPRTRRLSRDGVDTRPFDAWDCGRDPGRCMTWPTKGRPGTARPLKEPHTAGDVPRRRTAVDANDSAAAAPVRRTTCTAASRAPVPHPRPRPHRDGPLPGP